MSKEPVVETYRWNGWRYVLTRTQTLEEAEAEKKARLERRKMNPLRVVRDTSQQVSHGGENGAGG